MFESLLGNWSELLNAVWFLATVVGVITPTNRDNDLLSKVGRIADRIGIQLKSPKD